MTKTIDLTWNTLKINGDTVLYPTDIPPFGTHFLINQFKGVDIRVLLFRDGKGTKGAGRNSS